MPIRACMKLGTSGHVAAELSVYSRTRPRWRVSRLGLFMPIIGDLFCLQELGTFSSAELFPSLPAFFIFVLNAQPTFQPCAQPTFLSLSPLIALGSFSYACFSPAAAPVRRPADVKGEAALRYQRQRRFRAHVKATPKAFLLNTEIPGQ